MLVYPTLQPQHQDQHRKNLFGPTWQILPTWTPAPKICNRNTIKLSYRCTPSMNTVISARNKKTSIHPSRPSWNKCSCTGGKPCPFGGKCLAKGVIYKATVTQENSKINTYIGLTSNSFKKRFDSHNNSFKNPDENQTSLSIHLRKLQEKRMKHTIKWEQVDQTNCFSPVSGICALCTKEMF